MHLQMARHSAQLNEQFMANSISFYQPNFLDAYNEVAASDFTDNTFPIIYSWKFLSLIGFCSTPSNNIYEHKWIGKNEIEKVRLSKPLNAFQVCMSMYVYCLCCIERCQFQFNSFAGINAKVKIVGGFVANEENIGILESNSIWSNTVFKSSPQIPHDFAPRL